MSIPEIRYKGQYYEAEVPDTFDISDRAALGINGVAGSIDPDMDYQMWFFVRYDVKKPYMQHNCGDLSCSWKLLDDFSMLRQICGSVEHLEIERLYREHTVAHIKDGLVWDFYEKDRPRPWRVLHNPLVPGKVRFDEDFAFAGMGPRAMQAMQTWQQIDHDPVWDRYAEEIMDGFLRIALAKDDYLYLPPDGGYGHPFTYPASGWLSTREPESETEGSEGSIMDQLGFSLLACSMWHRYTGDPKALDIARRMHNFVKRTSYWGGVADPKGPPEGTLGHIAPRLPDPACIAGGEMGHWHSHFHAHARTLRGMLEYGITSGDHNAIEFVRRSYDYTWSMGIPRIGWINCSPAAANVMEGCAMGDAIALAVKLCDAGVGDYWDDADAVVRNMLAETQYTRKDLMQKMIDDLSRPDAHSGLHFDHKTPPPGQQCDTDVLQRTLGVMMAGGLPDHMPNPWVMQCCTGNGLQGFYYAWEGAVRENGDHAQVNLLINRAAKGLDVDSWLPYKGQVVIKNKNKKSIAVRVPGWADKKQVRQFVNDHPTSFITAGNYVCFTGLNALDVIRLEFPVPTMTGNYTINAQTKGETTYSITTRGSTVVDISPRKKGEGIFPQFLRDDMKAATDVRMKKTRRYVPDNAVTLW